MCNGLGFPDSIHGSTGPFCGFSFLFVARGAGGERAAFFTFSFEAPEEPSN